MFLPAKGFRLPIKELRAGAFFGGGAGSSSYSAYSSSAGRAELNAIKKTRANNTL